MKKSNLDRLKSRTTKKKLNNNNKQMNKLTKLTENFLSERQNKDGRLCLFPPS